MDTPPLSSVWKKAALLGSVWASIEIVLGTFLHALQFPLTGTLLAAIGVCILVAGSRIWDDRGLVWRTGVICAAMKSISPSAVILGPMAGIILEALLVEGALRVFGRSRIGYLTGGALAVATPLLQKIVSLLFAYGMDAARLLSALLQFVARGLQIQGIGLATLLLLLCSITMLCGMAAAFLGFSVSRQVLTMRGSAPRRLGDLPPGTAAALDSAGKYSVPLLLLHALAMPAGFLAIQELPLWGSSLPIALYASASFRRYPRIARGFKRPRLWIEFAGVSILAGLLLGGLAGGSGGWSWDGLVIGLQMTLRAGLVIVAFSAIGIEVRNPAVIQWLLRRQLRQLPSALEIAFQALPQMMSTLGEERLFLKHPRTSLARAIASAVDRLEGLDTASAAAPLFLLTGDRGSGKTTFLNRLVEILRSSGVDVAGITARAVFEGGTRTGYDLVDLRTGQSRPLCRTGTSLDGPMAGPYAFDPEAIRHGIEILRASLSDSSSLVCLDEVGHLELEGAGWAPILDGISGQEPALLIVVRESLLATVVRHWRLEPAAIWDVRTEEPSSAYDDIARRLR